MHNWLLDEEFGLLACAADTRETLELQLLPQSEQTLRIKGTPDCLADLVDLVEKTIASKNLQLSYQVQRPSDATDHFDSVGESFVDFLGSLVGSEEKIVRNVVIKGPRFMIDTFNEHLEELTLQGHTKYVSISVVNRNRFSVPSHEEFLESSMACGANIREVDLSIPNTLLCGPTSTEVY